MFNIIEGDVLLYDSAGNPLVFTNDGGTYRVPTLAKVQNSGGSQVNPATEDTLLSIKSTDGIKKITDPLPAGTNNIGDVDVASSALPTGAATEATLATRAAAATQTDGTQKTQVVDSTGDGLEIDASGRAAVQDSPNIDVALSTRASESTLSTADGRLASINTALGLIKDTDGIKKITDPLPAGTNNIGDVDVVSSALPTGAATEATLATRAAASTQTDGSQKTQIVDGTGDGLEIDASGRAAIQNQPNMDVALSTRASESTLSAADGRLATIDAVLDSIKDTDGIKRINDPLPAGTNNIGDVDVVSSALPAGAATEATLATRAAASTQTDGTQKTQIVDSTGDGLEIDASGRAAIQNQPNMDVALSTRATEATLLAADGRLTTIDAVLDSIKDVEGIKKITDQLPAGTNEIGAVAQGTKAAAANAWPEYIVDSAGNVVGVVLDSAVYRLQTDSKIAKGASSLVHLDAIDTTTGVGRLKATLYTQVGDPVSFPSVSESIKNTFVMNGGSPSLLVDGSVTPVVFEYTSDPTHDIALQEIKFTMASNSVTFGTNYFGAISGPLTTGLLVEVVVASGSITLYNLTQNESFVNFASPGGFDWIPSSKDMMTAGYIMGGGLILRANTTDKVRVTVRDNLTSAAVYLRCFVKGNVAAD